MEDIHIIDGELVYCSCLRETHYPAGPSIAARMRNMYVEYRRQLREMTPTEFVELDRLIQDTK